MSDARQRPAEGAAELAVRELHAEDLAPVARVDALHTGDSKPAYWRRVFREFLEPGAERLRVGLGAELDGCLVGYILGEVRAFEFGSDECGWIFAVGVDPEALRHGVASRLIADACARFAEHGVRTVRTMVRRNAVPVLAVFRANGFVGGSFVQLELDLEDEAAEGGTR